MTNQLRAMIARNRARGEGNADDLEHGVERVRCECRAEWDVDMSDPLEIVEIHLECVRCGKFGEVEK